MRTLALALAAVAAIATMALPREGNAQGRRPTPTPTATPSSPWIDVPDGTQPIPAHAPVAAVAAAAVPAPEGDDVTYRPVEKSVAIGAGYAIGAGGTGELLWNPNTVSARFRLPSGLAIEPIAGIVLVNDASKVDSAKTSATQTDIFAGANVRKPLWSRAQADMVLIVGADVGISSSSSKDAADQKTSSSATSVGASYGIGVEFWPRRHWSISFDGTTQLLGFASTNSKDAAGVKSSTTQTLISPAFDPNIRLMTHLYY